MFPARAGRGALMHRAQQMLTGAPAAAAHRLFLRPANVRLRWSVRRSFSATMIKNSGGEGYDPHVEAVFEKMRALRTQIRRRIRRMSSEQRAEEDDAIQSIVLESPWFRSSQCICAYVNCEALREVDTSRILSEIISADPKEDCTQSKKKLYLPRIEDRNSNMTMLHVSSYDDLIPNSMNILEPSPLDLDGNRRRDGPNMNNLFVVILANEPVDLFILPGLAFDRAGRRLGRSGGYYDVYLKKYRELAKEKRWKQPLLVALAYSVQVVDDDDAIAVTSDDIPVDIAVSPSAIIRARPVPAET